VEPTTCGAHYLEPTTWSPLRVEPTTWSPLRRGESWEDVRAREEWLLHRAESRVKAVKAAAGKKTE
jgi:hypothetical protein